MGRKTHLIYELEFAPCFHYERMKRTPARDSKGRIKNRICPECRKTRRVGSLRKFYEEAA